MSARHIGNIRDICILVSTCERYVPLARWTIERIRENWSDAPAIFVSGCDSGAIEGALPLVNDPRDWMAVTHSAACSLAAAGCHWVYLILDDLPPVGPCQAHHLNETLPRLAQEEQAVHIGLLGWGQRRAREGSDLGAQKFHLSRNSTEYRWKFSLHPSLWSVPALIELLEARMKQYPPGERTPWNFERHRDQADSAVSRKLLESTFRINGLAMTGKNPDDLVRGFVLFGFDVYRFILRITKGAEARQRFDGTGLWLYHYYRGPYPVFWSGAMRQGAQGSEFRDFLRWTRRRRMLEEWNAISAQISPAC